MAPKKRALVSIDIETRGKLPKNGILSVGIVVGSADPENPEVYIKTRVAVPKYSGQYYEPRCEREFWSQYPELRAKLDKESEQASPDTPSILRNLFDEIYDTYEVCAIISDFPSFDVGMSNALLAQHHFAPINYSLDENGEHNVFHPVICTDSYGRGLARMGNECMWTSDKDVRAAVGAEAPAIEATHLPDDDAEYIYRNYMANVRAITRSSNV